LYQYNGTSLIIVSYGTTTNFISVENESEFWESLALNGEYHIFCSKPIIVYQGTHNIGSGEKTVYGYKTTFYDSTLDYNLEVQDNYARILFLNSVKTQSEFNITNLSQGGRKPLTLLFSNLYSNASSTITNNAADAYLSINWGVKNQNISTVNTTPSNIFVESQEFFQTRGMEKLNTPTSAQQLEMLTVDANGQAVGTGNYNVSIWEELKPILELNGDLRINTLVGVIEVPINEVFTTGQGTKKITGAGIIRFLGGTVVINTTIGANNYIIIESSVQIAVDTTIKQQGGVGLLFYVDYIYGIDNNTLTIEGNNYFRYANPIDISFATTSGGVVLQSGSYFRVGGAWWHTWEINDTKTNLKGWCDESGKFTINITLNYSNSEALTEILNLFDGIDGIAVVERVRDISILTAAVGSEPYPDWTIANVYPHTASQILISITRTGQAFETDYQQGQGMIWNGPDFSQAGGYGVEYEYNTQPFPLASTLDIEVRYTTGTGKRQMIITGTIFDKTKI
jgi:hypothetical protein